MKLLPSLRLSLTLSGIFASSQTHPGSPIPVSFQKMYFDPRSVPPQQWPLEGLEVGSYLNTPSNPLSPCDNSLHVKILSQKCVLSQNLTYIIPSLHGIPEDFLEDDQRILTK